MSLHSFLINYVNKGFDLLLSGNQPADFTAQLDLALPQAGLYYIGVTTSDRGEQGRYKIQKKGLVSNVK